MVGAADVDKERIKTHAASKSSEYIEILRNHDGDIRQLAPLVRKDLATARDNMIECFGTLQAIIGVLYGLSKGKFNIDIGEEMKRIATTTEALDDYFLQHQESEE